PPRLRQQTPPPIRPPHRPPPPRNPPPPPPSPPPPPPRRPEPSLPCASPIPANSAFVLVRDPPSAQAPTASIWARLFPAARPSAACPFLPPAPPPPPSPSAARTSWPTSGTSIMAHPALKFLSSMR